MAYTRLGSPTWGRPQATSAHNQARQRAQRLYIATYNRGWLRRFWRRVWGRSSRLPALRELAVTGTMLQNPTLQTIPLLKIQGSQGRSQDFDDAFYPLHDHNRERWLRVALARELGLALPLVQLIRVGDIYIVADGHHRLSVARAVGQLEIEAEVTVWSAAHD